MKLLLDTHALLWWWGEPDKLSSRVRALITEPTNEIWISAVTAWELAIKVRLGKLPDAAVAALNFEQWLAEDGFGSLAITPAHALKAGGLVAKHRDPFDRMLASQGMLEEMRVVSRDEAIDGLGAQRVW